jgi:hypothetical protein
MKPIAVSTQAQYDEAKKLYQKTFDKSRFDIDRGKGMEVVEEVDYLIHNFLYEEVSKKDTENDLSRFYFTESQAQEIAGYFLIRRPRDLYDIERGLNALGLRADGEMNTPAPLIHIKDGREKISVSYPVEVFGKSEAEAFGHAKVIAHDTARITAHDQVIVEALDSARIKAFDQSHSTVRDSSKIILYNNATAMACNYSSVTARHRAQVLLFDHSGGEISDNALAHVYNEALVTAENTSKIMAFHDASIVAYNNAFVTAKDKSQVTAFNSVAVHAEDNTVITARDTVNVSAKHQVIVFTGENTVCEYKDRVRLINSSQNKPRFLKSNVLTLLDHPFIEGEPVAAVNLLIAASDPNDREGFSRQLKEMGCVDPESTNKVLQSLADKLNRPLHTARDRDNSWER